MNFLIAFKMKLIHYDYIRPKTTMQLDFYHQALSISFLAFFFWENNDKTAYVTVVLSWPSRKSVELYIKFKQN